MEWVEVWGTLQPNQVALGAIVTFSVLSILRGWIVPRKVLEERMADKQRMVDQAIMERDTWRAAHNERGAEVAELTRQNGRLIDGMETTEALIDALRHKTNGIEL